MARAIKDKVEAILRDRPDTRNSDKRLVIEYWRCFHPQFVATNEVGDWILLENIMDLTSADTIARCRQKIQEDGKFLATDIVVRERRQKEKKIRMTINSAEPDIHLPI